MTRVVGRHQGQGVPPWAVASPGAQGMSYTRGALPSRFEEEQLG
jgi:hypothetical protein